MVHYVNVEIDGEQYTIQQFTSTKAVKTFARLAKLLGVPFAMLVKGANGNVEEVLPQVIKALFETADEDVIDRLIKDLLSCVMHNNQPLYRESGPSQFETHFQGKFGSMFKLVSEVVQYQYKDFLADLAKFGGGRLKAPEPSL